MMQHGERIARVDAGARALRRTGLAGGARARGRRIEKEPLMIRGRRPRQLGGMLFDKARVDPVGGELRMAQQVLQEAEIGRHALDPELAQRAIGLAHQRGEVGGGGIRDQLGQQRIETRAGGVAGVAERIDAQPRARRHLEGAERAARGLGRAVGAHRFEIDAELHREAARLGDIGLQQAQIGQRASAGQLNLGLDQIHPGDLFGDGMLDLQARVGLDKGKGRVAASVVGVDQEFKGAEIVVADLFGQAHGGRRQPIAQPRMESRTRRDLDQLLVAPLNRAFALPQMADAARAVAEHLDFEMAGAGDQLLDVDLGVAKGRARLGTASRVRLFKLVGAGDRAHPAAPAADHRFDHHRAAVADRLEKRPRLLERGRPRRAGQHGHAGAFGQGACLHLVAEQFEHFRTRADKGQAGLRAAPREVGVLAQKAVPRMDRVASRGPRGGDNLVAVEIGGGARATQGHGGVGLARVQRVGIVGGKYGDRAEAHLGGGAHHANRDLAAVGNQELRRHRRGHRGRRIHRGRGRHGRCWHSALAARRLSKKSRIENIECFFCPIRRLKQGGWPVRASGRAARRPVACAPKLPCGRICVRYPRSSTAVR